MGRGGVYMARASLYVSRQLHTYNRDGGFFRTTGPPDHPDHTTLRSQPAADDAREQLIFMAAAPDNIILTRSSHPRPFVPGRPQHNPSLLGALFARWAVESTSKKPP